MCPKIRCDGCKILKIKRALGPIWKGSQGLQLTHAMFIEVPFLSLSNELEAERN